MVEMFHINPNSGDVGICKAKSPGSCPFGEEVSGIETHYEDPDEARSNAEWLMADKHQRYDYSSGLSKRERSAADDAMRNASRLGVVAPDKIKAAIAGFEVKSPYSNSMKQTYSGGMGEFVRQLTKNHNGGVGGCSGEMPLRTEIGEVLFKDKSKKRLEFYINGKPYAIDHKKYEGYTDYSDPYPLS